MAKNKRKPSAAQRDKRNIEIAKILKQSNILSKQAKLHSGNYISKEVLRKVRKYENIARLNYGAVKVSKEIAAKAKENGYEVVQGTKIIGPKTNQFRARVKAGKVTGVKPVKGGYLEEVRLPDSIYDFRSLLEKAPEEVEDMKMPDEYFAFKYRGFESLMPFQNMQAMANYLLQYKSIQAAMSERPEDLQEEFEAITIFRLHPNDTGRVIPGAGERKRRAEQRRKENKRNREYEFTPDQIERRRKADKLRKQIIRERIAKDPVANKEYNLKEAMRKREERKKKKGK